MRFIICFLMGLCFTSNAMAANFTLKSPAFSDNSTIPLLYSCNGKDISPALTWSNAPADTQAFALVLSSPDWTAGKIYLWVLYNIPANIKNLTEDADKNLPEGTIVGSNYYNENNYRGPCPPDSLKHHYVFTLYALDTPLNLSDDADTDNIVEQIQKHTLKQTQLTGIFSH